MKKLFLLVIMLGAFVASEAKGDPGKCWCLGGEDGYTYWYLYDCYGYALEEGDYVYVAWAGPNKWINPPAVTGDIGAPTGDDSLLVEGGIHEFAGFGLLLMFYEDVHPMPGDLIYCRVFDDPKTELTCDNFFGDSQTYQLTNEERQDFFCEFQPSSPYCSYDWCAACWPITAPPFIALMIFEALGRDGQVLLEWKTAIETDNFGFHIERSLDAVSFERITKEVISGAGDSETENTYTYVDRGLVNGTTYYYNLISVDMDGLEEVVNAAPVAATPTAQVPNAYSLSQNYPNPFNPVTEITYAIPRDVHVTLKVYNVLGHEVAALVDADREASFYTVRWDAEGLASGVYFCALIAGDFRAVKKMVLLK